MPKKPNSTATEPDAATPYTVEVTSPSTTTDDSVIVAVGADPRPAPTETADPKQPGRGRLGRRNGRGTKPAAATSTAAAEGPADPAATSPDPGTLSVSDAAESVGGGAGDAVPDRLWAALLAHPGTTAAELATAVGVGRSTVSKLLATWAEQGRATSAAGANPRAARQWTATPDPAPAAASTATPQPDPEADPSPRACRRGRTGEAANRAADTNGAAIQGPTTDPVGGERGRRQTAGDLASDTSTPAPSGTPARAPGTNRTGSARLGAGELRAQVEEFLAEHPGAHGPVEIGHVLRRSSGAIANALERLTETGWAERTSERPKRYRYADAEETASTDSDGGIDEGEDSDT